MGHGKEVRGGTIERVILYLKPLEAGQYAFQKNLKKDLGRGII